MSKADRTALILPAHNEAHTLGRLLDAIPSEVAAHIVVVDDGSTDTTADIAADRSATIIAHSARRGLGAAIRTGLETAREAGCEFVALMAANGKDDPRELPRLLGPLWRDEADYVQGSRYLPGGRYVHMPYYRIAATRLYAWLLSLYFRRRFTECTNGFRAYRLDLLDRYHIDLSSPRLDQYDLEIHLHLQVLAGGARYFEVPVTKTYPNDGRPVSKVPPLKGWWSMLRPFVRYALGVER